MRLHADVPRESPTVRGFVALLLKALDGLSPAEVAAVPSDLLDQLQLTETLGMMRTQGLTSILGRIKRSVGKPRLAGRQPRNLMWTVKQFRCFHSSRNILHLLVPARHTAVP